MMQQSFSGSRNINLKIGSRKGMLEFSHWSNFEGEKSSSKNFLKRKFFVSIKILNTK